MKNHLLDLSSTDKKRKNSSNKLKIMSWNLQSPSLDRMKKQLSYIEKGGFDILVLTELKVGKTFDALLVYLKYLGYICHYSDNINDEDYVTIISTKGLKSKKSILFDISRDEQRALLVDVYFPLGAISILGIYMPSFHPIYSKKSKIERKHHFNKKITQLLNKYFSGPSNRLVITGDLNILEPNHKPSIDGYKQWEYMYNDIIEFGMTDCFEIMKINEQEHSWYSHEGEGQRLDHFFVDKRVEKSIRNCYYDHSPRINKLSDHSVMLLELFD
ncbi:endonuclease/exonuclease/phosphatase family protein [Photobacterium damselae]|uniref:endonuclease/exonuclease/phosphatase family protein n=1 Tax=Photobacterium damselae TaxID=38293 RepID=UPI001EFDCC6E|nr:endonuclease/exonuclease/phosphatase family protein [Photobacterium damselae]MCG9780645.1 hypothetical protein [Photobacterium damselae]